jgi:hypothetical protein
MIKFLDYFAAMYVSEPNYYHWKYTGNIAAKTRSLVAFDRCLHLSFRYV